MDDLLDLAVWYASTRVISFVTVSGGWTNFYQLISEAGQPSVPPTVEGKSQLYFVESTNIESKIV